jgi:hypothetical protein
VARTTIRHARRCAFWHSGVCRRWVVIRENGAGTATWSSCTGRVMQPMSALPPKADIPQRNCDVRFVPKADSCTAAILSLSINPVGMAEQRKRYGTAECIGGIQEEISIDKDFKFAAVQRLEPVSILFVSFLPHPS